MKQHKKEKIINYTNIFKQASDIINYQVGPDILEEFIKTTEEYRNATYYVGKNNRKKNRLIYVQYTSY